MTLFDRWISIDWSAASKPTTGPNSIWIADTGAGEHPDACRLDNPPTRRLALEMLIERLGRGTERVLVGLDASLALPAPGPALLGAADAGWTTLWDLVDDHVNDGPDNTNDRFAAAGRMNRRGGHTAGPFWGHARGQAQPGLTATLPPCFDDPDAVAQFRRAELEMRAAGHQVQSTWKIAYPGSVGGQFLMAVGWIRKLQRRLPQLRVWPFETGFGTVPRAAEIWLGELWPGEFALEGHHPVRDADQVWSTARAVRAADAAGELTAWLSGPEAPDDRQLALDVEGWPWSPSLGRPSVSQARASGG
ncbi:MAG: hypothetical protein P8N02_15695 [Actinomycetota bacterium]|nr:hypothetical protein [Actinomycetota bacterium]